MKIHNSMSKTKEEFVPMNENEVKMYACGIFWLKINTSDITAKRFKYPKFWQNFSSSLYFLIITQFATRVIMANARKNNVENLSVKTPNEMLSSPRLSQFADTSKVVAPSILYE